MGKGHVTTSLYHVYRAGHRVNADPITTIKQRNTHTSVCLHFSVNVVYYRTYYKGARRSRISLPFVKTMHTYVE